MQQQTSISIYNASAGAGKTYTLVQDYLTLLLAKPYKNSFKHILAITFTNKAVGEMKERILSRLLAFSKKEILCSNDLMFEEIVKTIGCAPEELQTRAAFTLETLMHNYAAFEVSTIDKFTHKIIRTFAKDLKLSINFDVEMDTQFVLQQAVDMLIAKIGFDAQLTKILIDFALEKIDDDKSWDITFDLNNIAKLLLNENHIQKLRKIESKTFDDFNELKKELLKKRNSLQFEIQSEAQHLLAVFQEQGLQDEDFVRKSLPNLLKKLASAELGVSFDAKWIQEIEETKLHTAKTSEENIALIASLRDKIVATVQQSKRKSNELKFLNDFYKGVTPLSVIHSIQKTLEELKEEENIILISDFNELISKHIANQPAPFIYERLGEKFKHYFIDEFQDTSVLQWNNLIPLIENAISQENLEEENGSLTVVGDAKQSIYRWRGGEVDQFIELNRKNIPFYFNDDQIRLKQLPKNYRSHQEVINFNNSFFKHVAQHISQSDYKDLYQNGSHQEVNQKEGGYVEISFIESNNKEEDDQYYPKKVLEILQDLGDFDYSEICIITRKKQQGVALANHLIENCIPIISSETLLLENSQKVTYLIHLLEFIHQPENDEIKIKVLRFWCEQLIINTEAHDFYAAHIGLEINVLFEKFLGINLAALSKLSFYEVVESLSRNSKLMEDPDAYVVYFLDHVYEFSQKQQTDIHTFLTYWKQKKESLSVVSPQNQNAVTIMTIHKSKGLEFPVVIFPYADLNIYDERDSSNWLPISSEEFLGFEDAYVRFSKYFNELNQTTSNLYNQHRNKLAFDHYNLLYVTLTRAQEQLYIVSKETKKDTIDSYAGLLKSFIIQKELTQNESKTFYLGNKTRVSEKINDHSNIYELNRLVSNAKEEANLNIITREGALWNSFQEKAIRRGNAVHEIMEHIISEENIDEALFNFSNENPLIDKEELQEITQLVSQTVYHSELNEYFQKHCTVVNEKEILSGQGHILIPDRLNFKDDTVVVIDYKTGEFDSKHIQQISEYGSVLSNMNYTVLKKILVYIDSEINIRFID